VDVAPRPLRIILVDDSPLVLDVLTAALVRLGHSAIPLLLEGAPSLPAAVDQYRPDVVVLDVLMPGSSSAELTRSLGPASTWTFKLLLCSNLDEAELARLSAETGADGYILKSAGFRAAAQAIVEAAETTEPP